MDYQTLEIRQEQAVATVWLNRPDVRNAFNETSIAELTQAFRALDADASVRAVVLAALAVQLAQLLPAARPGTRVLPPETLWLAAQGGPDGGLPALAAWLRTP